MAAAGAVLSPNACELPEQGQVKQISETRTEMPELKSHMSRRDGEQELRSMARHGITAPQHTVFLGQGDVGKWLLVNKSDNRPAFFRGIDGGNIKPDEIAQYELVIPTNQGEALQTTDIISFLPNIRISSDNWKNNELLSLAYLNYKLPQSNASGNIVTPWGIIRYSINEKADHWAAFSKSFRQADDTLQYFIGEYPDSVGRDLKQLCQSAGPEKINLIMKYLYNRLKPSNTETQGQQLSTDIKTHYVKLNEAIDWSLDLGNPKESNPLSFNTTLNNVVTRLNTLIEQPALTVNFKEFIHELKSLYEEMGINLDFTNFKSSR